MSVESFGLVEHFDYMKNYIPQPFYIQSSTVDRITKEGTAPDYEYVIHTSKGDYTLTKQSLKKLVDALGIKVRLLEAVVDEADVYDYIMPAINKLFKCFSDCFVFYATADDKFTIIEVNVNDDCGTPDTRYENGPSPWDVDLNECSSAFTCFSNFMGKYSIEDDNTDILVKADDIMSSKSQVTINLFKSLGDSATIQPMITFSSKFSNMNGFADIHPVLLDTSNNITIVFPLNYSKDDASFDDLWKKTLHMFEYTDLNDYIFREVNELAASNETPSSIRNFISNILVDSTLNINQPIKDIMNECNIITGGMKPGKARKFKSQLGVLIGFCIMTKHFGCRECGHMCIH